MIRSASFFVVTFLCAVLFPWSLFAVQSKALPGTWTDAVCLGQLPDGSILVAQQSGQIDVLKPSGDTFVGPQPWADLGEGGKAHLVGFAIDPQFQSTGYVFAALEITTDQGPELQVTRWRAADNLVVLNKVLVDHIPSGADRTGGVLKAGPDGDLWLGVGDGGVSASEVTGLRGTLLRIQADGSIPADNPQPDSYIWATGLRDPHGLVWQKDTHNMYVLDRGPQITDGTMDELDLVEKSDDFGWPEYFGREGPRSVSKPVIYCTSGHTWIPGGAAYVDSGFWKGSLIFAGAGQGILYRLSLDAAKPRKILFYDELINGSLGPLVDVAMGTGGRPLLLSRDHVYELTPEDGD